LQIPLWFALVSGYTVHFGIVFDCSMSLAAFCFYNLSSIVNGLVYFNQFSLIPPLHLGLVVLGIAVLLVGVWVVSIQSSEEGVDIGTWQKGDEDIALVDECEEPEALEEGVMGGRLNGTPTMFGSSSEPLLPTLRMSSPSRSPTRSHRVRPSTISIPNVDSPIPTSHERQTTDSILLSPASNTTSPRHQRTTRLRRDSLYQSISMGNVGGPLGGGLQIGLSPVSPGFSIIPRERNRRRRVSGLGISEADGDDEEGIRTRRRRTLSEGDVHWRGHEDEGEGAELEEEDGAIMDEEGGAEVGTRPEKKKRWKWLRKVFRGDRQHGD